jgi:hypothetical protein
MSASLTVIPAKAGIHLLWIDADTKPCIIPSVARNPAPVCGGKNQSEIPRYARNDRR